MRIGSHRDGSGLAQAQRHCARRMVPVRLHQSQCLHPMHLRFRPAPVAIGRHSNYGHPAAGEKIPRPLTLLARVRPAPARDALYRAQTAGEIAMPTSATISKSAAIRARLNHPIIDSDGHTAEFEPALFDYLREVGGSRMLD